MNRKFVIVILIIIIAFLSFMIASCLSVHDFDGHFTMNVPLGKHYSNAAWCWSNGDLGCKAQYLEDGSECTFENGEIAVYYYNNSILSEGEANIFEQAIKGLTTSYFYKQIPDDSNLIVLKTDMDMEVTPQFLAGKCSDDKDEVVFVGGKNLNDVKHYADTIRFSN